MKELGCPRMIYIFIYLLSYGYLALIFPSFCLGSPKLLFSNRKDIQLTDSSLVNSNSTVLLAGLSEAAAVDFLYEKDKKGKDRTTFCWTEHYEGIFCATSPNLDDPVKIVSNGVHTPDGLAIDWVTQKLYWVDADLQHIEVCELKDGSHRKVLYYDRVDQPRALALDPRTGYMYWTDWGEEAKIERAGMNGDLSTRTTVISEEISWPNGLTIDYFERKLYWVDASLSYIHTADIDGTNRGVVINGSLAHPFAITVYRDRLYWTDWKNKSIFSCNKSDCNVITKVQGNLYAPMDIEVFTSERQEEITNPCAVNNGNCSHLCLLAPAGGLNCACPTGTVLNDDNHTCADVDEMIFLSRRFDLRMISLDTPDFTDTIIAVGEVAHAIAIDFDPVERYVYWTDDEIRLIQKAKLDGTDQSTIVSVEVMNPDGVAIDWISRNIFWTDTGTNRIEVARLDGSSRRVIISDELDEPRAIVVDPVNGLIYWTDWGTPAKIEKAAMDGSMREVIIDESLVWPNGIALDFEYMRLYWADAKLDKIERSNLDGTERTVIVDSELPHVFGFDVAGKYIYWTDWQRRTIERVDKLVPGAPRELIVDQLPDLMAIRVLPMKPNSTYTNGCFGNNGGCSNLCLNTPSGHVCACPMGQELLADNKQCVVPEAFLLFSQSKAIKRTSIKYAHKATPLPIQHLQNITALDIHVTKELIYFADNVNGSIRRAYINGSSVSTVLQFRKESPSAMVIDWISDNIYFIDTNMNLIEVYNIQSKARKVVVWKDLGDPRSITVHPVKGYIYWTDWDVDGIPEIGRANLDGTDQRFILSDIGRCGSITVDLDANRIYWMNYRRNAIQSAGLNGEDMQVMIKNLKSPVSLNIYGNYVYWYDSTDQNIQRVSKIDQSDVATIQTDIAPVVNLLVFHKSRQNGSSVCAINNGGCQYFCFTSGNSQTYSCGCPTHYLLNQDGMTCSAPRNFFLVSERAGTQSTRDMQVRRLLDNTQPDLVLPLKSLRSVRTINYDTADDKIYWIMDSDKYRAIKRSTVDGSRAEIFLHDSKIYPSSMCIEPYSRLLFWIDSVQGVVNVTTLDKKNVGVVYRNDGNTLTAVAVNPRKGYLFIVAESKSRSSQVIRTYLDGSSPVAVVTSQSIAAITIDEQNDWLYFADHTTSTIKSCSSNGDNIRTLVDKVTSTSLTIYKDKLYYTQGSTQLFYVDKTSGRNRKQVMRRRTDITDIHAVNADFLQNYNRHPCSSNNGDCSHICFIGSDGTKQCGCPDGLNLHVNGLSCAPLATCKSSYFACSTGHGQVACIPMEWRCDGSEECADGSDEKDCSQFCTAEEFTCGSGECIDRRQMCDRVADCHDSSDEQDSCCRSDKFMCSDKKECIPVDRVGDNIVDCKDGSDELTGTALTAATSAPTINTTVGIVVVLCIVFLFILIVVIFIIWKCRKRAYSLRYLEPVANARPGVSFDSLGTAMMDVPANHMPQSLTETTVVSASSTNSALHYDRNHVTGASSSSSSMTHLQAGFNPPPSPVTERSAFLGHGAMDMDDCSSTLVSSAYQTYYKRHHGKVPPTTPMSTCDDSEPSLKNYSVQRPRPKKYKKYHQLNPPPPTPSRSQMCSADEASEDPPSPSTVRSFRSTIHNPYPPPPSPEPTSDNS